MATTLAEPSQSSAVTAPMGVVIETRSLTKIYRDFWGRQKVRALNALDLEVRRGEIFGLLGPNGSGKSTTIKLLLGLLFPTNGQALVFGKEATEVTKNERIGYLPEESYLTARGAEQAEHHAEQGRLARAVGPDDPEKLATEHLEAHAVQDQGVPVLDRYVIDLEQLDHHGAQGWFASTCIRVRSAGAANCPP